MAYGIDVKNIYGSPIIDEFYSGYTVYEHNTLYIRESSAGSSFTAKEAVIPIDNLPTGSIFAFNPPIGVLISYWGNRVYSNSNVDVPYVILSPHSYLGGSNASHGIRVYNENSQVVFDSGSPLLNTLKIFSYDEYDAPPDIEADIASWIIPTTSGVVLLGASGSPYFSQAYSVFLKKKSNGDYIVTLDVTGTGPVLGDQSRERTSNYRISFIEVEIV